MWRGESGKLFHISDVFTSTFQDAIAPFENVCDFSTQLQFKGTLFRFPLRTTASELSENIYTVDKLHVLLEALKSDGKLLLLFLRSVDTIEVHEIFANGRQRELFCVSVEERDTLAKERKSFMEQVRRCHTSHGSSVNKSFTLATEFHVKVNDEERSHWLVVTRVGSEKQSILTAAAKQHVLPWVGTALELGSSSPEGRVFCFLPMPADASCPLPVHVNGTFALNSNRRTLKWPGVERRNDPEAEWNQTLVSELLPSCYDYLISKLQQVSQSSDVYSAWPDVNKVQYSHWSGLLSPLFALVFSRACIRCTEISHLLNSWIRINEATFLPECEQISRVVITTVTSCGLRLAKIPGNVWSALRMMGQGTSILFPTLVRAKLRQTPHSYQSLSRSDKLELLCYCLSDQNYSDLHGIFLLPLANGTFIQFQLRGYHYTSQCYICTQYCPRAVFPNESVDNLLVNLVEDADLMSKLESVASSSLTQLQELTVPTVASILPRCFPPEWQSKKVVTLPHRQIPDDWLERFWNWVRPYDLSHFCNLFLVPLEGTYRVTLTRLSVQSESSILYSETKSKKKIMSALRKLGAHHTSLSLYKYLYHRQQFMYWNQFTPDGILNALYNACDGHVERLQSYNLTSDEASYIRNNLSGAYSLNAQQQRTLSCIPIFETVNLDKLLSVSKACQQSWQGRAVLEPQSGILIQKGCLPSNVVVLSHQSSYQNKLVNLLPSVNVSKPSSSIDFILDTIFPIIISGSYPMNQLTKLMEEVLTHFSSFKWNRHRYSELLNYVREIPFLAVSLSSVRKQPNKLFDPSVQYLRKLYGGESVFPLAPFNTKDYLPQLRECGLCQTVSPQNIIDIIWSISDSSHLKKVSNTKLSRARAVLQYLDSYLPTIAQSVVSVPGQRKMYFTKALCFLAQNRCWLPIRCSPPDDYSSVLNWKGCAYKSHFLALNKSSVLPTQETASLIPHLAGSQVLIVDHTASAAMYDILELSSPNIQHVVAHFKQVIECKKKIHCNYMNKVVEIMYNFLNKQSKRELYQLSHLSEWIWLQKFNKFISPAEAAMGLNPNFQQNLEPFLYVLPDGLSNNFFDLLYNADVCSYFSKVDVVTVLQKMHDGGLRGITTNQAWRIVMAILNWLTEEGMEGIEQDDLFVPIQSETNELKLELATEVVYTDNEFLKEYLTGTESGESYTLVHSKVRPDMAKALGLTPLSQFLDITEDTFEDAGQCEPLTTRLKNILTDYKDGLTIIKELLQNADDAEATEVNICYDARVHSVDPKKLFFPGMADSHGPALIVHNNKTFSDDDFKNITQLAGGTKQNKPLKIGKFGIGFCSVYHITDVPSFISRDYLYIFDPTLKHLQKAVSNPARPGKKTKFTQKVISTSQQLQPYTGLFEFDPKRPYDGTMFRLPFRKAYSEISSTFYSESTVQELLEEMKESNSNLLLFLQHVKKITFSRFDPDKTVPTQLLEMHLSEVLISQNIKLLKLNCSVGREQYWLMASSSCWDRNEAYCTASVACSLEAATHQDQQCFKVRKTEGEVFCFLPLSLKTGLPVHVSSNFAVMNNRRGIWTSSYEETSEVQWNVHLMESVIPDAYHQLVQYLHELQSNGRLLEYSDVFYTLWPIQAELQDHNPWDHCVDCFYQKVLDSALFYSAATTQWLTLDECKFVEPGILCHSPSQQIPQCVYDIILQLKLPVVDLPQKYQNHFSLGGYFLTEEQFVKIFFDRIESVVQESRNETLFHMFEVHAIIRENNSNSSQTIDQCLRANPCVPCSPDGCVLRLAQETVDPNCLFSGLFDCSENRFPLEKFSSSHLVRSSLVNLGMTKSTIPWSMLAERAKSVPKLYISNALKALERSALIMKSISENLAPPDEDCEETADLATIPFIPVLQKPSSYLPLPWEGEGHQFLSGDELMIQVQVYSSSPSQRNICIAGSQVSFVCNACPDRGGCGHISDAVMKILEIRPEPTCLEVIQHMKEVIELFPYSGTIEGKEEFLAKTNEICFQVYEYLDSLLDCVPNKQQYQEDIEQLKELECIWTGEIFVSPTKVAQNWKSNGPYLYKVPESLVLRQNICTELDIDKEFGPSDLFQALYQMHLDYGQEPVDDRCKDVIKELITLIPQEVDIESITIPVMLPDSSFIIRKVKDLSFDDTPWCPRENDCVYVHELVIRSKALMLGVEPLRSKRLEMYSSKEDEKWAGVPFGQHEELTQRIQNILRDYPFDVTFLKELLQNADDAKATKMYVILDKRHHGKERVISEEWKDLQGPALLVWNDSVFSEKDIQGIQQLGLGSKRSDSDSIGQYGIGFNVVYHVTDCPSFVSNGETLCILDPHCRYVPKADHKKPGRRFEKLNSGFWDDFSDLKSAYLQDDLPEYPKEIVNKGSLFRFPLRHTYQLMKKSKIEPTEEDSLNRKTPLRSDYFEKHLTKWVSQLKEAFFFLNHVREFKLLIIESDSVRTQFCYEAAMIGDAEKSCEEHNQKVKEFIAGSATPHIVTYCLELVETSKPRKKIKEKWLIQQGIGDIKEDEMQEWKFIHRVKPRHGLAAPLDPLLKDFTGSVFCFLPLPIRSGLPVHVNGNFILDSSRRALWKPTSSSHRDERDEWNKKLLKAISSSYARLLVHCRSYFTKHSYKTEKELECSIYGYYSIFPSLFQPKATESRCTTSEQTTVMARKTPQYEEGTWLNLARDVYICLSTQNAKVLVCVEVNIEEIEEETTSSSLAKSQHVVHWHKLKDDGVNQVHFSSKRPGSKDIEKILKCMGMNVTCAPYRILKHFKEVECFLPETKPETVFEFYKTYFADLHVSFTDEIPCLIEDTAFKDADHFMKFSKYLLKKSENNEKELEFPSSPIGCPLLLTADGYLRMFDDEAKVIASKYSAIFQGSLNSFLCHKLLNICYLKSYFLAVEDCEVALNAILNDELPEELYGCEVVPQADQYFDKKWFEKLWKCLTKDPLFSHHLPSILKKWSLLPTQSNDFYSFKSSLLPLITDDETCPVIAVLEKIGVPFLNQELIGYKSDSENSALECVRQSCPHISDHKRTLQNLLHLCCENFAKLADKDLALLVDYLRNINFSVDPASCSMLRQLPIFLTIHGEMIALKQMQCYVWNPNVNKIGMKKWLEHIGSTIVFLDGTGEWRRLASSSSDLRIDAVPAQEIYTRFIFPNFSCLEEKERYRQLKHIKDHLFEESQLFQNQDDIHANFIDALKDLPCLGPDSQTLKCVSNFCSPDEDVFELFPEKFNFLPKCFIGREEKDAWVKFFSEIGLKMYPTSTEFIELCEHVAEGNHPKLRKASQTLLKALLSKKAFENNWHSTQHFIQTVSEISFVCTADLSHLTWIKDAHLPTKTIKRGNGVTITLTKLNGAGINEYELLWTVMPVIELSLWNFDMRTRARIESILNLCHVVTAPTTDQVIQNIINISKSVFSSISLFDKCPEKLKPPAKNAKDLKEVMLRNFRFLNSHIKKEREKIEELNSYCCVPICPIIVEDSNFRGAVLVKPCQTVLSSQAREYHPFLYYPHDLFEVASVLELAGVKREIEISHLRFVLEEAYHCSAQKTLDVNTQKVVYAAIKKVYELLKSNGNAKGLIPLYLPSHHQNLCLSTSLYYCDKYEYLQDLDLTNTDGSIKVLILPQSYTPDQGELCKVLPEEARPRPLSEGCKEVLPNLEQCYDDPQAVSCRDSYTEVLKRPIIANTILKIARHLSCDQCIELEGFLKDFFSCLSVVSVKELHVNVYLTVEQPHKLVGTIKKRFHLHEADDGCVLYLSKDFNSGMDQRCMYSELATYLSSHCECLLDETQLTNIINETLYAKSEVDIRYVLTKHGISLTTDFVFDPSLTPEFKKEIPLSWHHRLLQDPNHIFTPGEWVGWEERDGTIVFVRIAYPLLENLGPNDLPSRYKIFTSRDDEEGREVDVLDLYKFDKGRLKELELSESQELAVAGGTEQTVQRDIQEYNINSAKKEVIEELKKIWKLPEDQRKKAIRRLYLKWHPDKNLSRAQFADTIFKFLIRQLERLEQGLPLEDVGEKNSPSTPHHPRYSKWSSSYRRWNDTANSHKQYAESERKYWHKHGSSGDYGAGSSSYRSRGGYSSGGGPSCYNFWDPSSNMSEARKWVRQAEVDMKVLIVVLPFAESSPEASANVCFMAHQVAEKALKGGMYATFGLSENSLKAHFLLGHANSLQQAKTSPAMSGLSALASPLENYYNNTRYPSDTAIPADAFTLTQAREAKGCAEAILEMMKHLI